MISLSAVSKKFSVAAPQYASRADIQQGLAVELTARMKVPSGSRVVDIGTGTGNVLNELRAKQSAAVYIGLDVSEGMLKLARGLRVRADSSRLPFKKESIDIVVSASSYHWAVNLKAAFSSAAYVLKDGGRFNVVLFGRDTMKELFSALENASPALSVKLKALPRLPLLEDICAAIAGAGITAFDYEREIRKVKFLTVREILGWLSATGANGLGPGMFIGKEALARAEDYYLKHCGGEVSFEVIWLEARK